MNEEHAQFLESIDGKKRDVQLLSKLATAQGRWDYSVMCVVEKSPNGIHRYRALFDEEYKKRTNPGKERFDELEEEFRTMRENFHKQALEYYNGPLGEEEAKNKIQEDQEEIKKKLMDDMQGMGGPPNEPEDEWGLGLDDWQS